MSLHFVGELAHVCRWLSSLERLALIYYFSVVLLLVFTSFQASKPKAIAKVLSR
jgi:uncharacterized membrane protein